VTCPDCERHKISASMWRNKAYELSGTPLPWNAEELIEKAVLAEREACAKVCDDWPNGRDDVYSIGVAIRARGQE